MNGMSVAENIRKKLGDLPHKPGIYLMRDRFGTVIYVGKARDLRKRVSQYFQPSRRLGWDLKFKALMEGIHDFDFHMVRTEPEALLLEGKLIKEFHPRYNVSFRDDKRFLLLKVNLNDPIPRFTLTRLKQDDGARYFGPFPNSGALLSDLRRTTNKANRFERVPYSLPQAINPEKDLAELGEALGLRGPPHRIEGFDISNISGTFKVASLVSFRNGRPDRSNYRRFKIKSVTGQDDFASVAEVVRRRYTRVLNEAKVLSPESKVQSQEPDTGTKDSV